MVPIYEQIVDQIKMLIRNGELKENDNLPSVRTLSKELKISALTVKKAYDNLESEGFTVTVHGKGTYVAATNTELLLEEQINGIYRTVTMLSNNQLGVLVFRFRIVVILAVQECYDIRILLQRTGFTQVTEHGALNLTRFNATAQL